MLTPAQLRAQVAAIRKRSANEARAYAIHTESGWAGPDSLEVEGEPHIVTVCQSDLHVREALLRSETERRPCILLCMFPPDQLGEDVLPRLAGEQEHSCAQYNLGLMYYHGRGVPQDYAEAFIWHRKAAESGDADAQAAVGGMYSEGLGVPQDYAEAVRWFRLAAEQGHANAQFGLGVIYAEGGKGVPQDYVQALKWYRMAAEQGHAYAQCDLGGMYAQGQGVPQNDVEAYVWFSLSAAQGDELAATNRDNVARRMSRQEIVLGQQRAAAFVAKKEMADSRADEPLHSLPSATITTVPKGSGTGFFISDDGYLLTSFHVVAKADRLVVLTQAGTLSAVVVRSDSANDVALLKVLAKSQALPIVPSRAVALGNTVATVGLRLSGVLSRAGG